MKAIGQYLPAGVLIAAVAFFAYDIISDLASGGDSNLHILVELVVSLAISLVLFVELRRIVSLNRQIGEERSKTARLAGEMASVITEKFAEWRLTPSEHEVALLLIKGLSMKEIAEARQVKEKTVRLQATNIYAKSGTAGRHELAAYFIEDLMSQV